MDLKSQTIKLNNGMEMPVLGLGTWYHLDQKDMQKAVKWAMLNGYKHIDGAHIYLNETEMGEVYKELFESGQAKREDYFIASKLWSTHHARDKVEEACRNTLKKLNLDYLDIYYVHWPSSFEYGDENLPKDADGRIKQTNISLMECWKGMEDLVDKGLVKALAVCNYNSKQLTELIKNCRIKPVANQIENNPRIQNDIMRRFCEKHEIVTVGYSPFGSPDLPWGEKMPHLLVDETLKSIAEKHGVTTALVILRWQLQRDVVVIPKSVIIDELKENKKAFDFALDGADMKKIRGLELNLRKIVPIVKLKDGTVELRDEHSDLYPFREEETEDCLRDL